MPSTPARFRGRREDETESVKPQGPGFSVLQLAKQPLPATMNPSERRHLLPSMPEEDTELPRTWTDCLPTGRAFALPVVALHLVIGTAVWQHLMVPGSSIGDAFYFAVETFLTIGYGDITPASNSAKFFFIVFTVLSLVVQLTVLSTIVSSTMSMDPNTTEPSSAPSGERLKAFFKVRPRVIKAAQGFVLLFCLVSIGAVMLKLTSASEHQHLSWLDCWYWSVTTISTVGYGDIAPTKYRPLFACFFLVAVVLFANILGESIALVTELGNYRRLSALFSNGLGPEALAKMDNYQGDGRVSREEFLMFILQHLEIADRSEMEQILTLFESCDQNGDGILDLQDVKLGMSRRSRIAASRSGARPQSSFSRAAAAAVAATQLDRGARV